MLTVHGVPSHISRMHETLKQRAGIGVSDHVNLPTKSIDLRGILIDSDMPVHGECPLPPGVSTYAGSLACIRRGLSSGDRQQLDGSARAGDPGDPMERGSSAGVPIVRGDSDRDAPPEVWNDRSIVLGNREELPRAQTEIVAHSQGRQHNTGAHCDPMWHAPDPSRRASDPSRHPSDPLRQPSDPSRQPSDPSRHPSDPVRHVQRLLPWAYDSPAEATTDTETLPSASPSGTPKASPTAPRWDSLRVPLKLSAAVARRLDSDSAATAQSAWTELPHAAAQPAEPVTAAPSGPGGAVQDPQPCSTPEPVRRLWDSRLLRVGHYGESCPASESDEAKKRRSKSASNGTRPGTVGRATGRAAWRLRRKAGSTCLGSGPHQPDGPQPLELSPLFISSKRQGPPAATAALRNAAPQRPQHLTARDSGSPSSSGSWEAQVVSAPASPGFGSSGDRGTAGVPTLGSLAALPTRGEKARDRDRVPSGCEDPPKCATTEIGTQTSARQSRVPSPAVQAAPLRQSTALQASGDARPGSSALAVQRMASRSPATAQGGEEGPQPQGEPGTARLSQTPPEADPSRVPEDADALVPSPAGAAEPPAVACGSPVACASVASPRSAVLKRLPRQNKTRPHGSAVIANGT